MKTMRITGFTLTVLGALALGACSTTDKSMDTPSAEPSGSMESGMPPATGSSDTMTTPTAPTTDPTMPPTDSTTTPPTDDPTETPTTPAPTTTP